MSFCILIILIVPFFILEWGSGKIKMYWHHEQNKVKNELGLLFLPQNLIKIVNQKPQEELPGLGQFYCVFCARYFVENNSLESHKKTKDHRKKVKESQSLHCYLLDLNEKEIHVKEAYRENRHYRN